MQADPDSTLLQDLLAAETAVWQALAAGDAEADRNLLTPDFLGVYGTGFSDRATHAAQLADGPTVAEFALSEARVMAPAPDLGLIAYRARFRRPGSDRVEHWLISSLWRRGPAGWRNLFSQDTVATGAAE